MHSETHESPARDAVEQLNALQEWLREPDNAEAFGTKQIVDWLNRRPTHIVPAVVHAITAQPQEGVVPDGWVMVPREPTEAMLRAGVGQWLGRGAPSFSAGWQAYVLKTWNTMIAAAPKEAK